MNLRQAYEGKKVFITGHTGFKGTWLREYLHLLGVDSIFGYDLSDNCDIEDREKLHHAMVSQRFDFYFHLAAQSQVGIGYERPLDTYCTNVLGTCNFLDGLRHINWPSAAVIVTTDKVYQHQLIGHAFTESEPLGGHDPYSSSKACADLAAQSWHQSWFKESSPVWLATARAGNVIAGGDTLLGRIVPNFFHHLKRGEPVKLWMPHAVRPWMHAIDCIEGYLTLGAKLLAREAYSPAFNFGPSDNGFKGHRTVKELTLELIRHCGGTFEQVEPKFFEQRSIFLNCERAWKQLGWKTRISFEDAVRLTAEWHENPGIETTRHQIKGLCP